ncbi:hypothetical protein DKP84_16355 [Acinetobacter pittii]|nr:hypothetical protein DKP84_16355 [Acinetobacter pittii]
MIKLEYDSIPYSKIKLGFHLQTKKLSMTYLKMVKIDIKIVSLLVIKTHPKEIKIQMNLVMEESYIKENLEI